MRNWEYIRRVRIVGRCLERWNYYRRVTWRKGDFNSPINNLYLIVYRVVEKYFAGKWKDRLLVFCVPENHIVSFDVGRDFSAFR